LIARRSAQAGRYLVALEPDPRLELADHSEGVAHAAGHGDPVPAPTARTAEPHDTRSASDIAAWAESQLLVGADEDAPGVVAADGTNA